MWHGLLGLVVDTAEDQQDADEGEDFHVIPSSLGLLHQRELRYRTAI